MNTATVVLIKNFLENWEDFAEEVIVSFHDKYCWRMNERESATAIASSAAVVVLLAQEHTHKL